MKKTVKTELNPLVLVAFAAVLGICHAAGADAVPPKPNVLFIVVDDLRPELGCYGKDYIQSPNMDRIAAQGMVFNRAYCQQAVCSPTRSSLLTGTRPDTTRVWDLKTHFRVALPDVVTLPQHFKQNGYFVQGMGKILHGGFNDPQSWSVPWKNPKAPVYALPENQELNSHKPAGEPDGDGESKAAVPGEKEPIAAGEIATNRLNTRGPAFECAEVPDNTYTDGKVGDLAVAALQNIAGKKEPFFLAVGFVKPTCRLLRRRNTGIFMPPNQSSSRPIRSDRRALRNTPFLKVMKCGCITTSPWGIYPRRSPGSSNTPTSPA